MARKINQYMSFNGAAKVIMTMNRLFILSFTTFIISLPFVKSSGYAQSYEGTLGNDFVWFDLSKPSVDGKLTGSYFYKKIFVKIPLFGRKTGNAINLSEMGS
jgi:hypothetical protein